MAQARFLKSSPDALQVHQLRGTALPTVHFSTGIRDVIKMPLP
jgi:hypothetical protein